MRVITGWYNTEKDVRYAKYACFTPWGKRHYLHKTARPITKEI